MLETLKIFWLAAGIDGRETELSGGPRSKEGGLNMVIKQRDNGDIKTAVIVTCYASSDGTLTTRIENDKHEILAEVITKR